MIYIASMKPRGIWADRPDNCLVINATSAQSLKSQNRLDFSPMTPIKGGYEGFSCFENFWLAYKRYDYLDHLSNPLKREAYINKWKQLPKGSKRLYIV